ncbi:MAG: D-glycero-beta-D-manno-heptose 1,7-bisphosphate 7-phosphatase [Betaproteobacteria bacterium]|nr:D-glycero-beta-D-manno-heptose 1,7-bisphosphate 7-phosphatase [Betaproteobacteria bacterium]
MVKAVFLDRDGVINLDKAYVHRWDDFEFLPGAVEAMRQLHLAGYILIVVTNQAGIARGYYTERQFEILTEAMIEHLAAAGVVITAVYHCPHHPAGTVPLLSVACDCRKPAPGMLLAAAREHGVDLEQSILVGDKASDLEAARAAGVGTAYLVQSDPACLASAEGLSDGAFKGLADCARHILTRSRAINFSQTQEVLR